MKALRALISGALLTYPSEFREAYRRDILLDAEAEPGRLAHHLFEISKEGLAMRIEDFARDINYAVGRLRRAPLFVIVVTLTFALGIGANIAVFSAFNSIMLRPLPFTNADRLVTIGKRANGNEGPVSPIDVSDLRSQVHAITSIAGVIEAAATMSINGRLKTLSGATVSPSYFSTIGISPQIGRFFEEADGRAGQSSVVISDSLWRTAFNGNLGVLGTRISLDGTSYVIVGVTQPDQQVPEPSIGETVLAQPDYFTVIPDDAASPAQRRFVDSGSIGAVAVLASGTKVARLNAELRVASGNIQVLYPRNAANVTPITFIARPLTESLFGRVASSLWMVLFVVIGILLVACANVSNLIGARWSAREREVAIRRALGASNKRIAKQLFIETGVLAIWGGLAGLAFAYLALRLIPFTALSTIPRASTISIDGITLLYSLVVVGVTTVLAGLIPIVSLGRTELQTVLNSAGRSGDASRGRVLRATLIVAEVAIALAVVVSSGLLVRSFVTLLKMPVGFDANSVYVAPFSVSDIDNPKLRPYRRAQQQRLLSLMAAVPGVDAVALSLLVPLAGAFGVIDPQVEGSIGSSPGSASRATSNIVSPSYFRALGVRLLKGRVFADSDSSGGAPVLVVSESFADKFLPVGDPVGRRVRTCRTCAWNTVVGVVPDVVQTLGEPPLPTMYVPVAQHPPPLFSLIIHAPYSNLATIRREAQSAFAAIYRDKVPPEIYTVSDIVALKTQTQRFAATLLGMLALVPLLLAISGIYGVVSFSVTQRSREFGVRVALGARAAGILRDVLRRALLTSAIGVALGTVLAALDAQAITPYLMARPDFSASFAGIKPRLLVSPFDPLTFGVVIALIFACTAVAALIPALRATRVDPVVLLRYE